MPSTAVKIRLRCIVIFSKDHWTSMLDNQWPPCQDMCPQQERDSVSSIAECLCFKVIGFINCYIISKILFIIKIIKAKIQKQTKSEINEVSLKFSLTDGKEIIFLKVQVLIQAFHRLRKTYLKIEKYLILFLL